MVVNSIKSGREECRCWLVKETGKTWLWGCKTDLEDEFVLTQERKTVVYETF